MLNYYLSATNTPHMWSVSVADKGIEIVGRKSL